MKIGIVSDSHDNVPMLKRAIDLFNELSCDLVIHAGDIVAPFSIAVMGRCRCPWKAVYGNNDGEKVGLKMKAAACGGSIDDPPLMVEADGLRIVVLHDCDDGFAAAREHRADVVIFGHIHQVVVERPEGVDRPLIVNPGECGGWLSGTSSVAILETENMDLKIIELDSR